MEDFNSKYTGQQVEDLLDQVASGEIGDGSDDTYITPFTVEDVANLYNGNIATLSIPTALIEAVIAKKRVLIPSEYDFGNGFAELTYAGGYIGGGDAGLCAYFFMMAELYHIHIDDGISDGAIIANEEHVSMIRVSDATEIVGIASVKQTTASSADGGSNVVTVTLTDGTTSNFIVKNGSKGSNGTNGTNGKDGADGATFTPSVDSAGNLSWTNNKGLTNPPTVNIKGPKGDKGDSGSGGGGSSSGSGKEYIVVEPDPSPAGSEAYISNIVPNKTYIVSEPVSLLNISEFNVSDALSDEYNVIFKADSGETILAITSYYSIYWANGVIPTMEGGAVYELSIQRVNIGTTEFFNAVLTPFKLIE